MDNPAVLLLLLEQGNRSLVDHTRDFVHLVPLTHYPDSSLCTFYRAGLNIATKAQLSGEGPRESFADYIEWVLVSCRSSLTAEDDTSPTQDPEPSQPAPRHAEFEPEPTADDEPEPRATEPYTSDQVREPATSTVTGECNMEQVRAMESPAHCTTAGGELDDNSGDLIDFSTEDLENNSRELNRLLYRNIYLSRYACLYGIPTHPPSSAYVNIFFHLCSGLAAGPPASIGVRAGGSLISASSLRVQNSASALRPCGSTTALSVALDLRLFISASGSFTSCSASVGRPHGVVSPSSTMAPPSIGSTVGHHGCVLGPARFLLLRVPPVSSLAPPTIVTALDCVFCPYHSVFCPPPGVPSSAEASSHMDSVFLLFFRPSCLFCFLFSTPRGRAYLEGGVMSQFCLFVVLVSPIVSPRRSVYFGLVPVSVIWFTCLSLLVSLYISVFVMSSLSVLNVDLMCVDVLLCSCLFLPVPACSYEDLY
ncbi:Threonylcarbamoyl-AMP synthase [Labeo rohita]|uniref:Threonylcarbamoyl-AMP synthase n=1 Tax=Labeo rohita TaxID=84645 RepID=A0ABQ8M843_LABRO|nr:Threonylcarbamoyl-AMP synthase [Labeo rohita]